ncbi:unnamed protein product, partial [marine sediment metagenome]
RGTKHNKETTYGNNGGIWNHLLDSSRGQQSDELLT